MYKYIQFCEIIGGTETTGNVINTGRVETLNSGR